MKRCKVGDLVLVVKGIAAGAVGRIVGDAEGLWAAYGNDWLLEFPRPSPCLDAMGNKRYADRTNAPDDYLIPIRPDPIPETVTDDMEVPA